jgi:8-oxo-dGTP pyrophosphatase MutT (NUDIX family)/glyoxylase-like metal-dependent hydrolase (beta-lactamase superfamily II)
MTEAGLPRPAATVVLLRAAPGGPEVLLTRRPATMAFGPGLHVFPGGAVDPSDGDPRLLGRLRVQPGWPVPDSHAGVFMVAAIRELFEEAGILLATGPGGAPTRAPGSPSPAPGSPSPAPGSPSPAPGMAFVDLVLDGDLELRGDWLVPLSRWVTPPVVPRRYDARFFVTRLPPGAVPAFDGREVAGYEWATPADALAAMAAGRIELWTPTSTTLQQLAPARDLDDVRRHCSPRVVGAAGEATGGEPDPVPCIDQPHPLVTRVHLRGAGGIPGQGVDAFLVGRDRVVVVDPGDPNDEAATAILGAAAVRGSRIVGILLTAPVPDHAAGAEGLALRLRVPVHAGSGAHRVLVSDITPLADGDLVELADTPIRVHATPGTHVDHLAFEVVAAGAVLVGDLEGPGPSRAIPEPVDRAALARSRARIGALPGRTRLAAHRDDPSRGTGPSVQEAESSSLP